MTPKDKKLIIVIAILSVLIAIAIFSIAIKKKTQYDIPPIPSTPSPTPAGIPSPSESDIYSKNPTVANTDGDLRGTNMGSSIHFTWAKELSATRYVLFRSFSPDGPWTELGTIPGSQKSGIDQAQERFTTTLCYRLEARDADNRVIRSYKPVCIPKFEE